MKSQRERSAATPSTGRRFRPRQRVRRARDFQLVYREGVRERGALMTIVVRRNGLDYSRLGLSVGKRCWKHAVRRNRVRRVFRESFRLSQDELPVGVDIVMVGSVPGIRPDLDTTRRELVALGARAARRLEQRAARDAQAGR